MVPAESLSFVHRHPAGRGDYAYKNTKVEPTWSQLIRQAVTDRSAECVHNSDEPARRAHALSVWRQNSLSACLRSCADGVGS